MATAARIFDDMRGDIEAVVAEQRAVLGSIEAGVIQRLAAEGADRFAMPRAAGEHQGGVRGGMFSEDGEHPALILRTKVKEAVPGGEVVALGDEIAADGLTGAAPDVEDRSTRSQEGQEPVEPRLLEESGPAVDCPGLSVPLIEIHDSVGGRCHVTSRMKCSTVGIYIPTMDATSSPRQGRALMNGNLFDTLSDRFPADRGSPVIEQPDVKKDRSTAVPGEPIRRNQG